MASSSIATLRSSDECPPANTDDSDGDSITWRNARDTRRRVTIARRQEPFYKDTFRAHWDHMQGVSGVKLRAGVVDDELRRRVNAHCGADGRVEFFEMDFHRRELFGLSEADARHVARLMDDVYDDARQVARFEYEHNKTAPVSAAESALIDFVVERLVASGAVARYAANLQRRRQLDALISSFDDDCCRLNRRADTYTSLWHEREQCMSRGLVDSQLATDY